MVEEEEEEKKFSGSSTYKDTRIDMDRRGWLNVRPRRDYYYYYYSTWPAANWSLSRLATSHHTHFSYLDIILETAFFFFFSSRASFIWLEISDKEIMTGIQIMSKFTSLATAAADLWWSFLWMGLSKRRVPPNVWQYLYVGQFLCCGYLWLAIEIDMEEEDRWSLDTRSRWPTTSDRTTAISRNANGDQLQILWCVVADKNDLWKRPGTGEEKMP